MYYILPEDTTDLFLVFLRPKAKVVQVYYLILLTTVLKPMSIEQHWTQERSSNQRGANHCFPERAH